MLDVAGRKEEDFARTAALLGGSSDDFPKERRGWVYSSLGQVLAFQGKKEQAEEMFRNALRCFDTKEDVERVWVYLGHLACDFPKNSQALLDEVFQNLPQNTDPFEEPFILALELKRAYVFGNTEQQKKWAEKIQAFVESNDAALPSGYPWGLIYQMTAMLFRKNGETGFASYIFDKALWSFGKGEGILQELGKYCKERKKGKPVPEKIRFNYW